jgi:hypothetical protein
MTADYIPDIELARAALTWWPDPYRAEVMTGISLVESGGDRNAIYLNTKGLFAGYQDRGPIAINEAAIAEVRAKLAGLSHGTRLWQDPALFRVVDEAFHMGYDIWWDRFEHALRPAIQGGLGLSYSQALFYAYSGWSVYSHAFRTPLPTDSEAEKQLRTQLLARWAIMRPRARAAIQAATG